MRSAAEDSHPSHAERGIEPRRLIALGPIPKAAARRTTDGKSIAKRD